MGGGGKDVPHDSRRVLGDVTMTSMGGAVAPSGSLRHPDHPTAKNCPPPVQGSPVALKNIFVFFPEGSTFSWTE